jgi:hypothetical protein
MHESVWNRRPARVFKKFNFFLLKINFFYVLDRFDALISKIVFKNKKHHFDAFWHKKHFEKQSQPHFQTVHI